MNHIIMNETAIDNAALHSHEASATSDHDYTFIFLRDRGSTQGGHSHGVWISALVCGMSVSPYIQCETDKAFGGMLTSSHRVRCMGGGLSCRRRPKVDPAPSNPPPNPSLINLVSKSVYVAFECACGFAKLSPSTAAVLKILLFIVPS